MCGILYCESKENLLTNFENVYSLNYQNLLKSHPEIQVVCICTPNGSHSNIALDALEFDKHLVIEKPIGLTKAKCEKALSENPQMWVIAMSTLASGALKPEQAYKYLFRDLQGINSVVVGVSTKDHAYETFSLLNRYL